MVLVHVLGLIYSGVILLALVLTDVFEKRVRLKVYFAWAAGWLALLVWLPAIRASVASGKPHGWIPLPRLGTVLNSYFFYTWLEWIAWLHPKPDPLVVRFTSRGGRPAHFRTSRDCALDGG